MVLGAACSGKCKGCPPERHDVASGEGSQSETAVNVSNASGQQIITVTYNDGTQSPYIQYTPTKRTVLAGASMMGWSNSTDGGNTWTYGGKVATNADWVILWGDPAITTVFNNQNYVFLSNLAVHKSKYPDGGVISEGGGNGFYAAISGACIARSTNGGKTFALYQCVDDQHHFYDGGSMAASADGEVFAGFVDATDDQIDVWRSPSVSGNFSKLPQPFPAGWVMASHPRLRYDGVTNALYVAAIRAGGSTGNLYLNRYKSGAWGTPVAASDPVLIYPTINLSDRTLRTGPQFAFDVGTASQNGNDRIRFLYTRRDSKTSRLYVAGSRCADDLSGCWDATGWATGADSDVWHKGDTFSPNVRAFPGFIGIEPQWRANYMTRDDAPNGNKVRLRHGNLFVLPNGSRIFISFELTDAQVVCSDNRGYWGDYDDLQFAGLTESASAKFLRAYTNSFNGCTDRTTYTAKEVHTGAAVSPE
jgi:hypothetical protein